MHDGGITTAHLERRGGRRSSHCSKVQLSGACREGRSPVSWFGLGACRKRPRRRRWHWYTPARAAATQTRCFARCAAAVRRSRRPSSSTSAARFRRGCWPTSTQRCCGSRASSRHGRSRSRRRRSSGCASTRCARRVKTWRRRCARPASPSSTAACRARCFSPAAAATSARCLASPTDSGQCKTLQRSSSALCLRRGRASWCSICVRPPVERARTWPSSCEIQARLWRSSCSRRSSD
mmetsp:Transcript_53243/g.122351  ORF Transcript_53243/g.122351 Transcript_53243/m.122351 type:complete len:237 (+) Transcript_53243:445-1155(+)